MFGVVYFLFLLFGVRRILMSGEIAPHTSSIKAGESHTADDKQPIVGTEGVVASESEVPLLPPPREDAGEYKEFKLGETMQMDELGPMIITPEGHVRRIANWQNLTKAEQAVAWRRISARNKQRIEALREAEQTETDLNPKNEDVATEEAKPIESNEVQSDL